MVNFKQEINLLIFVVMFVVFIIVIAFVLNSVEPIFSLPDSGVCTEEVATSIEPSTMIVRPSDSFILDKLEPATADFLPVYKFGFSMDTWGRYYIVSNTFHDPTGAVENDVRGEVFVFYKKDNGLYELIQTILCPDFRSTFSNSFGSAVRTDGSRLIISAPTIRDVIFSGQFYGVVYVYDFIEGKYELIQKIPSKVTDILFGSHVEVKNGEMIITDFSSTPSASGDAYYYVFDEDKNLYEFKQIIERDLAIINSFIGDTSFDQENGIFAIGYNNENTNDGRVRIYYRDATGVWGNEEIIDSPDIGGRTFFGQAISMKDDYLVVGHGGSVNPARISVDGEVFIYKFNGSSWDLMQTLTSASEDFGVSVLLDGPNLYVSQSSSSAFNTDPERYGSIYLYVRDSNGTYVLVDEMQHPSAITASRTAFSLHISEDNTLLASSTHPINFNQIDIQDTLYTFQVNKSIQTVPCDV